MRANIKFFAIFAVVLTVLVYLGYKFSDTTESTPCTPDGMPARCYHVNKDMCELIWKKSEVACQEAVKKLNLPPGRLTGPFVNKCQLANFDKSFVYARKSSAECDPTFVDLEDWRRRNDSK